MTRMWAAAGMLFNLWPTELCAQYPPRKIFITELASEPRIRVPDTFQLGAISPCSAFLACRKINKLRVFNTPGYSDSLHLHLKSREKLSLGIVSSSRAAATNR